ncbi:PREDICTED: uncharacterized protein At2g23090 [Fragaria vesca subsp. vesca]|nr:PREDICTED: uncharacterized protein At2g23090 [Fragaria vesca subsp. vesca]
MFFFFGREGNNVLLSYKYTGLYKPSCSCPKPHSWLQKLGFSGPLLLRSSIARAMGGGNGQKAKMAREKAQEKAKNAGKGSQLETNKKAMSIQCKVCMQTFMCTTSEVKCREHAEAKHPKSDVYACFPHLKP